MDLLKLEELSKNYNDTEVEFTSLDFDELDEKEENCRSRFALLKLIHFKFCDSSFSLQIKQVFPQTCIENLRFLLKIWFTFI